ncbi:PREDICTED: peroxidasin homolog [Priapulus caudatus]|uniref:Peroxidasin homolog n=1 Tax=Priapulus caudatus TaxID=37621 RepID=A0ABM1EGE9_PRICU|nr:PREDICTED: peroxidasin homolog [Priapulus caudatus]
MTSLLAGTAQRNDEKGVCAGADDFPEGISARLSLKDGSSVGLSAGRLVGLSQEPDGLTVQIEVASVDCTSWNDTILSQSQRGNELFLRHAPFAFADGSTRTPIKGSVTDYPIECNVLAQPADVDAILWYRNGEQLATNDANKYAGESVANPTLILRTITVSDSGAYQCRAHNSVGWGPLSLPFSLSVQYTPIARIPRSMDTVQPGAPYRIQCIITADPSDILQVEWLRDNEVVETGGVVYGRYCARPGLILQTTTQAHAGSYRCRARNAIGLATRALRSNSSVQQVAGEPR